MLFVRSLFTGKKVLLWPAILILLTLALKSSLVLEGRLPGNDDQVRLQQIRDLIAGQDWFDVDQTRFLTPEGGQIHWSRLPDIIPSALILATRPVIGQAHAEILAVILWPLILLCVIVGALVIAMRRLDIDLPGQFAGLFLFAMGGSTYAFLPGRIDHHNLVIVLVTIAFVAALKRVPSAVSGIIAAACMAAALSIALESLPYIGTLIVIFSLLWVARGARESPRLRGFGLALVGFACLFYFADAPGWWGRRYICDAYGHSHAIGMIMAGAWLVFLTFPGLRFRYRATRMALVCTGGILTVIATAAANPACLGDPYAGVPEQLRLAWLDSVGEARNFAKLWQTAPDLAVTKIGFATSGLLAAGFILWQAPQRVRYVRAALVLLMLVSLLVAVWQIRAAVFAHIFAVIAVSGLIDKLARTWWDKRTARAALALALVACVASPISWTVLAKFVAPAATGTEKPYNFLCKNPESYAQFAKRSPMRILAPIDLGASLLVFTPHSIFAAPYHRNVHGLERVTDVFMGKPEVARKKILAMGADHLLYCQGLNETWHYRSLRAHSFAAIMENNQIPDWLEPVEGETGTDGAVRLYRVRPLHADGRQH